MTQKVKRHIYTPFGWGEEENFIDLFDVNPKAANGRLTNLNMLTSSDVVVLEGGQDIASDIYGKKRNPKTQEPSKQRDAVELAIAKRAIAIGAGIFGICRGAQLACALAGGTLVQDINGHYGAHPMETVDGRRYITSSVHHQMMNPWNLEEGKFKLLAWADEPRSDKYEGENPNDTVEMPFEPEVIWFPKIKSIAVQGHPEYGFKGHPFVQYCRELVKKYLLDMENVPETPTQNITESTSKPITKAF